MHATLAEPDTTLLFAAARPVASPSDGVREAMAAGPDWTALVQAALDHGVAALLCRRLLGEPDLLPGEIHAAARAFLGGRRRDAAAAVKELFELLDALATAGVVAVPFKGPTLAQQAYDEPTLRGCRDLDLLIAESDIAPTIDALARLGFRSQVDGLRARHLAAYYRYNGQDILFAPGRLPVEPHWAFAPRTLAAPIDVAGVLARAGTVTLEGRPVAALSAEDALLVTCFHGSKEEWSRLVWIADVAGLLHHHPTLDVSALLERADRAGIRRMVLLGVAVAVALLDAACPAPLADAVAADPQCRRLAEAVREKLFRPGLAETSVFALSAFRWSMRERLSDRLRYALATLVTARAQHFRAVDLPDALAFLYPAVRLGHDYVALPLWLATRRRRSAS
jgi:hypothetical protein